MTPPVPSKKASPPSDIPETADSVNVEAAESSEPASAGRFSLPGIDRALEAGFRWSSVIETLLFAGAILIFNYLLHPQDPGYLSVQPHPFWGVVLLISIRYVFKESILSALIVAAIYSAYTFLPEGGTYRFSALALFSDFKDPLLFLIVAGFISGYTQHLLERTQVLRRLVNERNEEIAELRDQNRATTQALRRLEGRIAGEFTSILDLFAELARTKQMSSDEVKRSLLDVLVAYLDVEQATYYDVERQQLLSRFVVDEKEKTAVPVAALSAGEVEEDFLLTEALNARETVHLGQFARQEDLDRYQGRSLLAGTLCGLTEERIGLVSIERLPFVDYNAHTFKLFGTILQWWGTALDEALQLEELRGQSVFDTALGLYNYAYFANRLAQELERTRRFSLPMSLALLRIENYAEVRPEKRDDLRLTLARIVNQVVTELEMAALYKADDLLAISFPIAMVEDAEKKVHAIGEQIAAFAFHPYLDPEVVLSVTWAIADYEIGMDSHEELIANAESKLAETVDA